jgi:putative ABC transport system permease protein
MFFRLLFESFRRQKRRKTVVLLAVALGMTIATAMIAVAAGIGDKISQELRSTGANLRITPVDDTLEVKVGEVNLRPASEGAFIAESELPKLKRIFWGNNIRDIAPYLTDSTTLTFANGRTTAAELIGTYFAQIIPYGKQSFTTGVRSMNPWWQVTGEWPPDYAEWPPDAPPDVLVGNKLAARAGLSVGDQISVRNRRLRISGVLDTGGTGAEAEAVVVPLHIAQQILGRPNAVNSVTVSAITKPEDAFARRDPSTMSGAIRDRWFCSPYANSIAYDIGKALTNVRVEQIRQVEQNQGRVLSRVSGLMLLLTLAALLASALAVSAAMAATILERRHEVGLMKSLGASNAAVASLLLTEAGIMALAGGTIGFFGGAALAHRVSQGIFGSSITVHPVVMAVVIGAALAVTFLGSAGAVRKAMRFDPAVVLRGDA